MRSGLLIASLLAVGVVVTPALAKHRGGHPQVACKDIKNAIAAGKTAEDVAKDLKTTAARVKQCTAAPAKKRASKKG